MCYIKVCPSKFLNPINFILITSYVHCWNCSIENRHIIVVYYLKPMRGCWSISLCPNRKSQSTPEILPELSADQLTGKLTLNTVVFECTLPVTCRNLFKFCDWLLHTNIPDFPDLNFRMWQFFNTLVKKFNCRKSLNFIILLEFKPNKL